jgi:hypothetical protein
LFDECDLEQAEFAQLLQLGEPLAADLDVSFGDHR